MVTLLAALTVVEILLLVVVLAVYVTAITNGLRRVADTLAKVTFGVRAVEVQVESVGPALQRVNELGSAIADALPELADAARRAART